MTKKELRKHYMQLRLALTQEQRDNLSMQIANRLLTLPIWDKSTYDIFLTVERLGEINTEYLLDILYGKDKNVVVPKMHTKEKRLSSILLTEQTLLRLNSWGIAEPDGGIEVPPNAIEVVFVPLLAYDRQGNRVGYGGGYYDRFLSECKDETLKVGISFFPPEDDMSAVMSPTDIALDYVVFPQGCLHIPQAASA